MTRSFLSGVTAMCVLAGCAVQPARLAPYHLIRGVTEPGRQPNGNTVVLDAPEGLIVVDTGRRKAQQQEILAVAAERARPIAAIVNTHWHLDHSGGNAEVRKAHPGAAIVTSRAVEGALAGFLAESKKGALEYIASGQADAATEAEIRGDIEAFDERISLLPTVPVTHSGPMTIAGRRLQVNLASHAATEGDVWLVVEDEGLAIVGDLVVAHVPYMDTACPEGWRRALDQIAAAPFQTLVPGHGEPMTRQQFTTWRTAFNNLLDCAASSAAIAECAAGWRRDASEFVAGRKPQDIDASINYYMQSRLRSEKGRVEYCPKS